MNCDAAPLTDKQKDELIELRFQQLNEAGQRIAELEAKVKYYENTDWVKKFEDVQVENMLLNEKVKDLEEENYKLKLEFDRFSIKNAFTFHRCSEDVQEAIKENTKQIVEKIREYIMNTGEFDCFGIEYMRNSVAVLEYLDDLLKEYEESTND